MANQIRKHRHGGSAEPENGTAGIRQAACTTSLTHPFLHVDTGQDYFSKHKFCVPCVEREMLRAQPLWIETDKTEYEMIEILSQHVETCPLEQLGCDLSELGAHIHTAQYRFLVMLEAFDRRGGWDGFGSCVQWLGLKIGMSSRAARDNLRVARALPRLPKLAAAMASGRLSYSKARCLCRVATAENEDYLLDLAQHGTATHVERIVWAFRRATEAEELSRAQIQHAQRSISYAVNDSGSFIVKACLPPELGILFIKALDDGAQRLDRDESNNWCARRADALSALVETYIKAGPKRLTGAERAQVVVHVDVETLQNNTPGQCEIERGPSIAAETARRLACDSSVITVIENPHGDPLNVGRRTRSIPAALRRAIHCRDRTCVYPGCGHIHFTDIHHVIHWAAGGETSPANCIRLCSAHHRAVHEGGYTIQRLDDGAIRFVKPDGTPIDPRPGPNLIGDWQELFRQHEIQGIKIDSETPVSWWSGEPLDLSMSTDELMRLGKRGQYRTGDLQ